MCICYLDQLTDHKNSIIILLHFDMLLFLLLGLNNTGLPVSDAGHRAFQLIKDLHGRKCSAKGRIVSFKMEI